MKLFGKFPQCLAAGLLAAAAAVALASCGYHVAGQGDLVPKGIHTVAIPPFRNATVRYKLTDRLAEALSHEFIAQTRFHVVTDPAQADAVVQGIVTNVISSPIIFDPATQRASGMQVTVFMQVSFTERATGKVIWSRPSFEFHDRYEIAQAANQYFEESDTALARLSQDVARDVIASIMDNF